MRSSPKRPAPSFKNSVLLALVFGILFPPTLISVMPGIGAAIKVLSIAVFAATLLAYIYLRARLSSALILLLIWRVALLFPTVLHDGDFALWGHVTIALVSALMIIDLATRKGLEGFHLISNSLLLLFGGYLAWNLLVVVAASKSGLPVLDSYFNPGYPLGIRTRISDTAFIAFMVALICDYLGRSRIPFRTLFILVIVLPQFLIFQVATAWIGFVVLGVCLILMLMIPASRRLLTFRSVTVFGTVLSLLVTAPTARGGATAFISELFGKSSTLTGRTDIWNAAWPYIKENLILGHGINRNFGQFVPAFDGSLWQAHNQHLQLLYDGGILGLILFVAFLWNSGKVVYNNKSKSGSYYLIVIIVAAYSAYTAMMVSEIFTYNMATFMLIPFLHAQLYLLTRIESGEDYAIDA